MTVLRRNIIRVTTNRPRHRERLKVRVIAEISELCLVHFRDFLRGNVTEEISVDNSSGDIIKCVVASAPVGHELEQHLPGRVGLDVRIGTATHGAVKFDIAVVSAQVSPHLPRSRRGR